MPRVAKQTELFTEESKRGVSTGLLKQAWLIVARGGWWSVKEIISEIPIEISPDNIYTTLWMMEHRFGYVESRGEKWTKQYRVGMANKIPKDLTLLEVLNALQTRTAATTAGPSKNSTSCRTAGKRPVLKGLRLVSRE